MIQFEPAWFKKLAPYAPSGKWSVNKVDVQSQEWKAFNDAFAKNPDKSIIHHKTLIAKKDTDLKSERSSWWLYVLLYFAGLVTIPLIKYFIKK